MDIRKLDVFCKVVELKSFTRAARAVLLSQPTVSDHIRHLEEELGQKLVDRSAARPNPRPRVACSTTTPAASSACSRRPWRPWPGSAAG